MIWRLIPEEFGLPLLIRTLNERFRSAPPQTASATVPASATAVGTPGELAYDTGHLYVCAAPNVWKRTSLTTF